MEVAESPTSVVHLASELECAIASLGTVIVAFSGGVDSSVVAAAAFRALGHNACAISASSESTTHEDIAICSALARQVGIPHEVLEYSELAIDGYAANGANRCFFCKNELHGRLTAIARERGIAAVLDGSNADDGGDYRPGLRAVALHGIVSPLRGIGATKSQVRALARHYGLPNHDRPASPCLSSRIPYGSPVTREKLTQVASAERFLRSLGLIEFRCRHHGDVARLEVSAGDFPRVLAARDAITAHLKGIGFRWVALDLADFRSGSLNDVLGLKPQTQGEGSLPEGAHPPA